METPGPSDETVGDRVVSGLAVDKAGRQYQAHGPAASHRPLPGVTPLCETYSNPAMSLGGTRIANATTFVWKHGKPDWENPVMWQNLMELGVVRLTPAAIEPCKAQ